MKKGITATLSRITTPMPNQSIFGVCAGIDPAVPTTTGSLFDQDGLNVASSGNGMIMPVACTISNIYAELDAAPGIGMIQEIVIFKNGAPTTLDFIISDANTTGNDTVNTVTCAAGDRITLVLANGGATNSRHIAIGGLITIL